MQPDWWEKAADLARPVATSEPPAEAAPPRPQASPMWQAAMLAAIRRGSSRRQARLLSAAAPKAVQKSPEPEIAPPAPSQARQMPAWNIDASDTFLREHAALTQLYEPVLAWTKGEARAAIARLVGLRELPPGTRLERVGD